MNKAIVPIETLEVWMIALREPCPPVRARGIARQIELTIADSVGIIKQAEIELSDEYRREMIDAAKEKIKRGNIFTRLFPFKLVIIRRD